ncbi:hypothetical protein [Schlesneria paludicola]|uniref:hypothetical protein n=1 Tax=Schlesneria paludicola TaxID=360056 RepID=UPI000299EB44|nr:hypothetical protein [Schlesneria paludicola]
MKKLVTIIAEQADNQWSVWFADLPQVSFSGDMPADGIRRLLAHFGADQFDEEKISAVEDETREGHLEFVIPLRYHRRIPAPSVN